MDTNKLSYIGVKALIRNAAGEVLITQEPLTFVGGGTWELPGGKIAEGEESVSLEDILLREVREELGDGFKISVGPVIDIMRRPWNKPGARADQVFLAVFECTHESGDVTLSDENHAYEWITSADVDAHQYVKGYLPVLKKYFARS